MTLNLTSLSLAQPGNKVFATKRAPSDRLKRVFDFAGATFILVLFMPLFVGVALALVAQGWPMVIRHRRVGKDGKTFLVWKFRTMVVDAEARLQQHLAESPAACVEWASTHKLKNDPRVTPTGHALRKTSLDELPQLFNVLRGEMSLVGPRPIVPSEVEFYGTNIERYYRVRPGMTGAWQVSGRSDLSYDQRVALDCQYVEERSFFVDIMIILMTVPAVLRVKGSY